MAEEESILYFDLNIGKNYLSDWKISLALREIIANALDEDENAIVAIKNEGIVIKDKGKGLKPEHFIYQETEKRDRDDKNGKFGVGLKDAIGVLSSRGVKVEIKSKGYRYNFEMKEKNKGSGYETLHATIKEIKEDSLEGTEFRIFNCSKSAVEEAKLQFIKFQTPQVLAKTIKGDVIDKGIDDKASIYLNGMKISEDSNLRFSYNITNPSSTIKKGINRERQYVSRTVYQKDISKILENVDDETVLNKLVEQMERSYEDKNYAEIKWKSIAIKTSKYILKNGNVIFISNEDIDKRNDLYKEVVLDKNIRSIKVSPKIKETLKSIYSEKDKVFLEDFEFELKETVSINDLDVNEKKVLEEVVELLKGIDGLRGELYLLDNVIISKENIAYKNTKENSIVIPREALSSINSCSSSIIDAIASVRHASAQFKNNFIGEICSELFELKNKGV